VQTGPGRPIQLVVNAEAADMIARLGLVPLPREGGFFAPAWTSPRTGPDGRALASQILFLLTADGFSALHRLRMDETWHFSGGDPAELVRIDARTGACRPCVLGPEPAAGHRPLAVVEAGVWQGARLHAPAAGAARGWSLVGCTVVPAWDEGEFELGSRDGLLRAFPAHAALIRALTR
jgi:predicted cupin superfamily sugar epimerase